MENLPEPDVIASEIVGNLEFAVDQFKGKEPDDIQKEIVEKFKEEKYPKI